MYYQIKPEGFKFKEFSLDPYEIVDLFPDEYTLPQIINFYQHNFKMGKYWKAPKGEFVQIKQMPEGDIPDLAQWLGGSLVLSPKAFSVLKQPLLELGELLPIHLEGTTYYLFNCLTIAQHDEINSRKEQVDDDGKVSTEAKLSINSTHLSDKLVFKTKFNNYSRLYCSEKFKQLIVSNKLSGLTFEEDLTNIF